MIQLKTILESADNTGAKKMQCVKVLGSSRRRYATVGDVIVVAIKESTPKSMVKAGSVQRAVVVRTKKSIKRADGSYVRFDDNAAVIVDKENKIKGSRVFGPVARELREKDENFMKIISLAPEVV